MGNDGPDGHEKNAMINLPSAPRGTLRYDLCKCPCGVDTRFPGPAPVRVEFKSRTVEGVRRGGGIGHGVLGHVLITDVGEEKRTGRQRERVSERGGRDRGEEAERERNGGSEREGQRERRGSSDVGDE